MEPIKLNYYISGSSFATAGEASAQVKKALKSLGFHPQVVRRAAIAMYEGEINMVIHAGGGEARVAITPELIEIVLADNGPGIDDVEMAMQEGYSTASDNIRSQGFGAGMGLPNMKKYSDCMHVDSIRGQGTVVTLTILADKY